jgi:DinB family protein
MSESIAVKQILAVLGEAMHGPSHKLSYFLDKGPGAGLRNTLAGLSAEEASQSIGGTSIAAHVHHVVFSARAFGAFISGDHRKEDWNESWVVSEVDAAAWDTLRADVAKTHEDLRDIVRTHAATDDASMGGSIGAVAHVAYHVGAIRQKVSTLRSA